jgi:elongation factor G
VPTNDNGKFCSLAFKLWTDPYAGKLVFFRVYSGQLKKGDTIYNPRTRKRERVSRLMVIQGSERKDINEVLPATSPRSSACATSRPATRFATRIST